MKADISWIEDVSLRGRRTIEDFGQQFSYSTLKNTVALVHGFPTMTLVWVRVGLCIKSPGGHRPPYKLGFVIVGALYERPRYHRKAIWQYIPEAGQANAVCASVSPLQQTTEQQKL